MDVNTPVATNYGDQYERFIGDWKRQAEELRARFGAAIDEVRLPRDHATDLPIVYVKKEAIIEVLEFVKSASGYEYGFLSDLTATDEESDPRFEVVYHLFSHKSLARIRFKVRVRDGEEVPTLVKVWPGANWQEREVYDMFGIKFTGHPDLRRILMDERWVGYPLRKDYPLRGYQIFPDTQGVHPELLE